MKIILIIVASFCCPFVFSQEISLFSIHQDSLSDFRKNLNQSFLLKKENIYKDNALYNNYLNNQNLKYNQGYNSPFDYKYPKTGIDNPYGATNVGTYLGFGILNYLFEKINL